MAMTNAQRQAKLRLKQAQDIMLARAMRLGLERIIALVSEKTGPVAVEIKAIAEEALNGASARSE